MTKDADKKVADARPPDELVEAQRVAAKGGDIGGQTFPNALGQTPSIRDQNREITPPEPYAVVTGDAAPSLPANAEPRFGDEEPSDQSATRGQEHDRSADYTPPEQRNPAYTYPNEEGHIVDPRVIEEKQRKADLDRMDKENETKRAREERRAQRSAKSDSATPADRRGAQAYATGGTSGHADPHGSTAEKAEFAKTSGGITPKT